MDVDADTAMERLMGDSPRPLLLEEDPGAAWRKLYRRRLRHYNDADIVVNAQADPATVALQVDEGLALVERAAWSLSATLGAEATQVACYRSLFVLMRDLRTLVSGRMVCIVVDSGVARS